MHVNMDQELNHRFGTRTSITVSIVNTLNAITPGNRSDLDPRAATNHANTESTEEPPNVMNDKGSLASLDSCTGAPMKQDFAASSKNQSGLSNLTVRRSEGNVS